MPEPPKLAEVLLRWLVGGRDVDAVLGDVRETYESRSGGQLWYWKQALSCLAIRLSPHRRRLPGFGQDFHHALRRLRRNPGYAFIAVLCLALAMGVNTTMFSFLDSLFFRELPVSDAGRIVVVRRDNAVFCTWQEYLSLREGLRSMEAATSMPASMLVDIDEINLRLVMEAVSENYGHVLRVGTTIGTWFMPETASSSPEPTVVISHHLWVSQLNRDPNVLGKRILVQEMPYRIGGVGPPGFRGTTPPLAVDVWVLAANLLNARDVRAARTMVNLVGRLRPGASLQNATAEMALVNARLRSADANNPLFAGPFRVERAAGFLWASGRHSLMPIFWLMCGVCGMVMLIACVNIANLLLSGATVRRRDIALRKALGASRGRLFREVLAEGFVLAAGGMLLGGPVGYGIGRGLEIALPSIPVASGLVIQFEMNWRIALLLGAVVSFSALLFSLPPALQGSRLEIVLALKGEGSGSRPRQLELYSIGQVALSLALLVAASLMLRALDRAQTTDLGFATDHRLYVDLFASPTTHQPENARQTFTSVLEKARSLPGVRDATLASRPLGPAGGGVCASASSSGRPQRIAADVVDPTYFQMMRVPIARGRAFTTAETAAVPLRLVVNETMAKTWWPGEDAIGKTLWLGCNKSDRRIGQVIGIARNTRYAPGRDTEPAYYASRLQDPGNGAFALIIRTAGNPYQWVKALMTVARNGRPSLRAYELQSLDDAVALSIWEVRWEAAVLAGLGFLAVVLAAIGLYGVVAYAVSQRTLEFGIRMALGATKGDVEWMVLGNSMRLTAIGIVGGLLLSLATMPLLQHLLYGLSPFDPIAFSTASMLWVLIAGLASWHPARRATRVDPLTALKYE